MLVSPISLFTKLPINYSNITLPKPKGFVFFINLVDSFNTVFNYFESTEFRRYQIVLVDYKVSIKYIIINILS